MEEFERREQQPKWNKKYESVRAWLKTYFENENGKCEKLPNPRYGRDEWRLPIWLPKRELYRIYSKSNEDIKGKI